MSVSVKSAETYFWNFCSFQYEPERWVGEQGNIEEHEGTFHSLLLYCGGTRILFIQVQLNGPQVVNRSP